MAYRIIILLLLAVGVLADDGYIIHRSNIPTDNLIGAVITMDEEHYKTHSCERFMCRDTLTLNTGDSAVISFSTPGNGHEYHISPIIRSTGQSIIIPIIRADSATGGSLCKSYPFKLSCTDTGTLELRKNATVFGGTRVWPEEFGNTGSPSGAGRFGGETSGRSEIILEHDQTAGFVIRSNTDANKYTIAIDYYIQLENP